MSGALTPGSRLIAERSDVTPSGPSYRGYVYLIGSVRFGWYKIGKSKNASIRINHLGILLPFRIEIFGVWKTDNPTLLESHLHDKYRSNRINGEWFSFTAERVRSLLSDTHPHHAILVEAPLLSSTIEEERIVDASKEMNNAKGRAFCAHLYEYMDKNGMERTKENKRIARQAVEVALQRTSLEPSGMSVLLANPEG